MKITPVDHDIDLLGPSVGRSSGLHVSDLYNSLYQHLDPKRYKSDGGGDPLRMSMGVAWERYMEERLLASGFDAVRPPEFTAIEQGQPVHFSPDLIVQNGHARGGEIKLTYMYETDYFDDPKFAKYHTQAMDYGHHLGINRWLFYVLYVNGRGRKPLSPSLRAYDVEYTAREMREEWQMSCNHGRKVGLLR